MLAERKAGSFLALLPGIALELMIPWFRRLIFLVVVAGPVQLVRRQLEQVVTLCHTFVSCCSFCFSIVEARRLETGPRMMVSAVVRSSASVALPFQFVRAWYVGVGYGIFGGVFVLFLVISHHPQSPHDVLLTGR